MNHHLFKTRGQIQPFTLLFLSSMVANSLARIGREISEKIWNLDLPSSDATGYERKRYFVSPKSFDETKIHSI